jgi:hypothetical protein
MRPVLVLTLLLCACVAEEPSISIVSGRVETKIQSDATTEVVEKFTLNFQGKEFSYGRRNIFCGVKGRASNIVDVSVSVDGLAYEHSEWEQYKDPGTFHFECSENTCDATAPDCVATWYFHTRRRGSFL